MMAPARILLVGLGTRGDVQPFCVLGRELASRGYDVRVATTPDYAGLVGRFGLAVAPLGRAFGDLVAEPRFEPLFGGYLSSTWRTLPLLRALAAAVRGHVADLLVACAAEIDRADLVVYNPFAFFAGELAREAGLPAIAVMCQPGLPSRTATLSLFGGGDLGALGNRLSYESLRVLTLMLRGSFRVLRRRSGRGRRLRALVNPLTLGMRSSRQIMAYSPALSPPPGDWPVEAAITGFWHGEPQPGERLSSDILTFLAAGPAPVYVGFGSMLWGARRNTEMVLRAVAAWGGRAILATGPGSRAPSGDLPATILPVAGVDHALLFPRMAAIVHHGGAGTTAAMLRARRPGIILPMLGDQLYWGRRVAEAGAAEAPVALGRITSEDLAVRLARLDEEPRYAHAADAIADIMAREPGVAAAADIVDRLQAGRPGAR